MLTIHDGYGENSRQRSFEMFCTLGNYAFLPKICCLAMSSLNLIMVYSMHL